MAAFIFRQAAVLDRALRRYNGVTRLLVRTPWRLGETPTSVILFTLLIDPGGFEEKSFDPKSSLAFPGPVVGMKEDTKRQRSVVYFFLLQPI